MSCVMEDNTAPVEDIITKVRGVVSTENQVIVYCTRCAVSIYKIVVFACDEGVPFRVMCWSYLIT